MVKRFCTNKNKSFCDVIPIEYNKTNIKGITLRLDFNELLGGAKNAYSNWDLPCINFLLVTKCSTLVHCKSVLGYVSMTMTLRGP